MLDAQSTSAKEASSKERRPGLSEKQVHWLTRHEEHHTQCQHACAFERLTSGDEQLAAVCSEVVAVGETVCVRVYKPGG